MSTTVTISPSGDGGAIVALTAATVVGAALLLHAVLADDAECKRMLEQVRREERERRFNMMTLRTSDLGRLARSAREARFTVQETRGYLRVEVPGQRDPVWAVRTESGIAIAGGRESGAQLKVANTLSRLTETLVARGSSITFVGSNRSNGALELVATAPRGGRLDIGVLPSGEAVVDAVNHSGPECEEVARALAVGLDGRITSSRRKPEFFGRGVVIKGTKQRA